MEEMKRVRDRENFSGYVMGCWEGVSLYFQLFILCWQTAKCWQDFGIVNPMAYHLFFICKCKTFLTWQRATIRDGFGHSLAADCSNWNVAFCIIKSQGAGAGSMGLGFPCKQSHRRKGKRLRRLDPEEPGGWMELQAGSENHTERLDDR